MQETESIYGVRTLVSPAAGEVFPARELDTSVGGERYGEGLAVGAGGLARLYYSIIPAAEICAPASGAVTAAESRWFRLRTGDGLELQVSLSGEAEYYLRTGDLAAAGKPVCRISREDFRRGRAGAVVTFCDSGRITELHVISGIKRAGTAAAEYRVLME